MPSIRRPRSRWLWIGIGVLFVALAGLWLAPRLSPHLYAGTILQGDAAAPSTEGLTTTDGEPFDVAEHRGNIVLLYFGYTNCPDICPTTLATVSTALDLIDRSDRDRIQLVMVSVDPERDAEILDDYVTFFDPSFAGVTGEPEALERVSADYGVFYDLLDPEPDGTYEVDHTTSLLGVDTDGVLRIVWPPDMSAPALAADLEALLG